MTQILHKTCEYTFICNWQDFILTQQRWTLKLLITYFVSHSNIEDLIIKVIVKFLFYFSLKTAFYIFHFSDYISFKCVDLIIIYSLHS